jgi:hypothetical protein
MAVIPSLIGLCGYKQLRMDISIHVDRDIALGRGLDPQSRSLDPEYQQNFH